MLEGFQILKKKKSKGSRSWYYECRKFTLKREHARMKMMKNNTAEYRKNYERRKREVKNMYVQKKEERT